MDLKNKGPPIDLSILPPTPNYPQIYLFFLYKRLKSI